MEALLDTSLFKTAPHSLSTEARINISIAKAQKIATAYALTLDDIVNLSPKFWNFHSHPIIFNDGAATTLLTIQFNLVIGTILDKVGRRSDLLPLLQDLLEYKISGQFCLTELDHGLDAANIETTATELENGEGYILDTPHLGAAKYMPSTAPHGTPSVAVVMARLVKQGVDLGVNPFLVYLHDGKTMRPGITARRLPQRGGSTPLHHSVTSFHRVALPASALLVRKRNSVSADTHERRLGFFQMTRRVAVGSLALSAISIPALGYAASIATRYSQRRLVDAQATPIITFPTQQAPILVAFAQAFVLEAFYKRAGSIFTDESLDFRVRYGITACFKAVAMGHAQDAMLALSERCGAQGLFNHNKISEMHSDLRGITIAEGDILGLSIRLATELLLNRYSLDKAFFSLQAVPSSPLALHAEGLLSAGRATLAQDCGGAHRSPLFAKLVLPRCRPLVEALGMHYAYAAAVSAGVDERITRLYLANAMRMDEAWYVQNLKMTQKELLEAEADALKDAMPELEGWVAACGAERYVQAPIVDAERWHAFVGQMQVFPQKAPMDRTRPSRL